MTDTEIMLILAIAAAHDIPLDERDIVNGTIDGMDPHEWLEEMAAE